jgi:GDPmannose 4,6-dehydratase
MPLGTLRLLEAIRFLGMEKTRLLSGVDFRALWLVQEIPQKETTPFSSRVAVCRRKNVCLLDRR